MTPTQGSTLGGRYTLTERIAAGGMGDVWAARDSVLGRVVAVKIMRPRTTDDPTFASRFRDEAWHTAALTHPNIAAVHDYGEEGGTAYLVMELVPGRPLSALIAEGPLSTELTTSIVHQAALALAAAHRAGVIHRDVKPANIMVTPEGQVKLTDFGIARAMDAVGYTRTGEVLGTPQYLSPEQATGAPVTGATDLYSLGIVAHEMLTGAKPFDRGTPVATALAQVHDEPPPLPATVTDPLRLVIEACLAKDPHDRPESAAALADMLGMPSGGLAGTSPLPAGSAVPPTVAAHVLDPSTLPFDGPTPPDGPGGAATTVLPTAQAPAAYEQQRWSDDGGALPRAEAPKRRRPGAGLWWLLPVLAALIVGAVLLLQTRAGTGTTPTPTVTVTIRTKTTSTTTAPPTTSAPPSTSTTGTIAAADYIGKQVGVVRSALGQALFKNVTTKDVASAQPVGTVVGVTPVGTVSFDQTITVSVSDGSLATSTPSTGKPTSSAPSASTGG
jgi:serine/threonine-protein kinase